MNLGDVPTTAGIHSQGIVPFEGVLNSDNSNNKFLISSDILKEDINSTNDSESMRVDDSQQERILLKKERSNPDFFQTSNSVEGHVPLAGNFYRSTHMNSTSNDSHSSSLEALVDDIIDGQSLKIGTKLNDSQGISESDAWKWKLDETDDDLMDRFADELLSEDYGQLLKRQIHSFGKDVAAEFGSEGESEALNKGDGRGEEGKNFQREVGVEKEGENGTLYGDLHVRRTSGVDGHMDNVSDSNVSCRISHFKKSVLFFLIVSCFYYSL